MLTVQTVLAQCYIHLWWYFPPQVGPGHPAGHGDGSWRWAFAISRGWWGGVRLWLRLQYGKDGHCIVKMIMTPEKWWKTINDDNLTKCGRSWEEENILTLEVILKWHSIESQRAEEYRWMAMTLWNDFNPNQRYLNSPIVGVIGQNDNHTSLLRSISEVTKMTWNQAPRIENAFSRASSY